PYYKMMKLHRQRKVKLAFMFPEFLTTFISLLGSQSGGNVIQTLRLTSDYVKEPLKTQLNKLVESVTVNSDPESSYQAFREFADFIGTRESSQVMMLVYEMYIHGTDDGALAELEDKIDRLNDNKLDELVIKKNTKLRGLSIPSLVLTTAFIFVWVGVVIVQVMTKAMDGLNF
ncbi:type II secretion system F family protein, partial [Bacillus mycoides]|uniref:type II secretion system F family protein n=1 Tax=Bacillus mycoides TaxID=1405 RepID=UPI003A803996